MSEPVNLDHATSLALDAMCDGEGLTQAVTGHVARTIRARLATLTRDLASARTALAEAKGVLRETVPDWLPNTSVMETTRAVIECAQEIAIRLMRADAYLARIDALAGEGGA